MRSSFLFLLCVMISHGIELTSTPAQLCSLNGTGFSSWQNLDDARCDTPRAAAAECYARVGTETLEAQGFDFDLPSVSWLEARWDVSVVPVPADGWILRTLQLRWNESALDLSSPNHTSHDEGVSLRIRVTGEIDWRNVSLRIAFESTNEDATFLVSCIELRAGSDWTPPEPPLPRVIHYEFGIAGAILLLLITGCIRRARSHRAALRRSDDDTELMSLGPSLFVKNACFDSTEIIEGGGDTFVEDERVCTLSGDRAIACKLKKPGDRDRFHRLQTARHANLVNFLGLYDGGGRGLFTIWSYYRVRLNDWRRDQTPCAALGLRISQVAACALSALQRHLYVHGDVACRNLVIEADDRIALVGAGHAREHDVPSYLELDNPRNPLRWMAPEAVSNNVLDLATDRWSLGVLLWEACSSPDTVPFGEIPLREFARRASKLELALEQPEHATDAVWAIAQTCLRANRDERANIDHVRDALLAEGEVLGTRPGARDEDTLLIGRNGGRVERQIHKK